MNVELHIEELVLRGLGSGVQYEIRAAMERELAELLRTEGASSLSRQCELSQVAGSFSVKARTNPQAIGGQLAEFVYRSILR